MELRDNLLDLNKICRLCLTEETVMSSIFLDNDSQSNSVPLPLRIMACVSIEVSSNDGLPSQICGTCLCQVEGWYKFKDLCENADSILRRCISNEPVQVEGVAQIQSMAQEVKKYFSHVKDEKQQSLPQEPKKKMRALENSEDGNRLYSLLTNNTSGIKEESLEEREVELVVAVALEHNAVKAELSSDDSLDNETLANRIKNRTLHSNGYSSDDGIPLYQARRRAVKSKRKVMPRNSFRELDESGTDESSFMNEFDEEEEEDLEPETDKRRRKACKEKTAPKKRFRIRPAVPSSCTLCDKVYKNSEILRQHMKSHHVTGTIECGRCKMTFTSLRSLKYHEQRKHSNLEPVPCSFCGKEFLDKKYLRIHENIHSQANQYVCQFCGRKFIMKTNLTVHISRHHTLKTNDFICQVCGKAFPFKLYLKKHFKTHTDYKPHECSFCGAKFREPTLLRKHINSIHLKLRPFLCQVCHKTFTRSLYLREHMESQHLGIQKKLECSRCGEHFPNRSRLRQHECEGRLEVL